MIHYMTHNTADEIEEGHWSKLADTCVKLITTGKYRKA
jgi:hypothetical protein